MQNLEKSRQVKWICENIIDTVISYEGNPESKIYFDYDNVLKLLEQAQATTTDTARCLRPENLPPGIPWSERMYSGDEEFDPFVYDGTMSIDDYEKMHELLNEYDEESENMEW